MKNKKTKGIYIQDNKGYWNIDQKKKIDGVYRHITSSGYRTLQDAKNDYDNVLARYIEKHCKKSSNIVFEDLVFQYTEYRKHSIRSSSLEMDDSIIRNYFLPFFSGMMLSKAFKQDYFNRWYLKLLSNESVSNARKDKVRTRIKDMVNFAYLHHFISTEMKQDCDCCLIPIKYSKKAKTERVIWTDEERDRFLKLYPKNSDKYVMNRLFYGLGLRVGEFLALTPKAFDYKSRKITIFQQANFVKGKSMLITETLKNETSYRTITIDEDSANYLKNYIDRHHLKDDDIIFTATKNHNRPMGRTTFSRNLKSDCLKAKVRPINPHSVRHMIAVRLAQKSKTTEDIEQASKRMGHTPSVFMDIYANHSNNSVEEKLNECLFA